jgi:UPF0755 protein
MNNTLKISKEFKKIRICSKILFFVTTKFVNYYIKIKTNVYNFYPVSKILKKLKIKNDKIVRITIPEGSNIKQIANIISKVMNIDKEKFINIAMHKKLEGYLMPETYFVNSKMDEKKLIEMMYIEFNKKITPDMRKRAKERNLPFKDIIIIASIIEKEAVKPEERFVISAVFYNRLKKNIKLQSCATVLYAIGSNKKKLSIEDTKFNSPYNTYLNFGLPPGPISNPGIQSIKAALYPDKNNKNLFFVANNDNFTHLFATNFDKHRQNKQIIKLKQKLKYACK